MRTGIFFSTPWRRKQRLWGCIELAKELNCWDWNTSAISGLSPLYLPPIINWAFSNKAIKVWIQSNVYGEKGTSFSESGDKHQRGKERYEPPVILVPALAWSLQSTNLNCQMYAAVLRRMPLQTSADHTLGPYCFFFSPNFRKVFRAHLFSTAMIPVTLNTLIKGWVPTQLWNISQEQGLKTFHWQLIFRLNLSC